MEWVYKFNYNADTETLTISYSDRPGDRVETFNLGNSCPETSLYVDSSTGVGVRLVIPDWHRAQKDVRLVRVFDLLGPAGE